MNSVFARLFKSSFRSFKRLWNVMTHNRVGVFAQILAVCLMVFFGFFVDTASAPELHSGRMQDKPSQAPSGVDGSASIEIETVFKFTIRLGARPRTQKVDQNQNDGKLAVEVKSHLELTANGSQSGRLSQKGAGTSIEKPSLPAVELR